MIALADIGSGGVREMIEGCRMTGVVGLQAIWFGELDELKHRHFIDNRWPAIRSVSEQQTPDFARN